MLEFLHLDRYDREAVLLPAIFSTMLIVASSWQLIDYVSYVEKLNLASVILLIGILAVTVFWYHMVRLLGKKVIESLMFRPKLSKLPTTRFLLMNDNYGNELIADKVRQKIETDFHIILKNKAQERKNTTKAIEIIESAVKLIKKKVQASNNDMYLRKNTRYGFFRNTTGGCLFAVLIEIVFAAYSLIQGIPSTICLITLAVSLAIMGICYSSTKNAAREYADELFETYLAIA